MSELFGMSFDGASSPSIHIKGWEDQANSGRIPTGWGFGWYPVHESGAVLIKDPIPTGDTALSQVLRDWERFRATIFICHIRGSAKRSTQENTHPFCRSHAGRNWLFTHNGQLDLTLLHEYSTGTDGVFEPIGHTDSEWAFCWLLEQARSFKVRSLKDLDRGVLHQWFQRLNEIGSLNLLLSDGLDLVAYRDKNAAHELHFVRRIPPHPQTRLSNEVMDIDLSDPLDINRSMVFFATTPIGPDPWIPMAPGEMIVARRGQVVYRSGAESGQQQKGEPIKANEQQDASSWIAQGESQAAGNDGSPPSSPNATPAFTEFSIEPQPPVGDPVLGEKSQAGDETSRILSIEHETTYRYGYSVERSTQILRLRPVHDLYQQVLEHRLELQPQGESILFEDVFGNHTTRIKLRKPYYELSIRSISKVKILQEPHLPPSARRSSIPLIWMPWQRQMMQSYLLPPELPESQLRELTDYAMSFVERQDYDLIETLLDINRTINRDYSYVGLTTSLETTPFEVYIHRQGVCQDFANLFICLARLLGIPARYRVGYIYTGEDYDNKIQSDASHAWVELFLPWAGWRGFDPTNGCLTGLDHVRVAVGRNFRDATPTSGTIFKGGTNESLSVSVVVKKG